MTHKAWAASEGFDLVSRGYRVHVFDHFWLLPFRFASVDDTSDIQEGYNHGLRACSH